MASFSVKEKTLSACDKINFISRVGVLRVMANGSIKLYHQGAV